MFGMGVGELLVVLVVVLVVFGPGRLPEVMGNLGKAMREFQKGLREPPEMDAPAKSPTPPAEVNVSDSPGGSGMRSDPTGPGESGGGFCCRLLPTPPNAAPQPASPRWLTGWFRGVAPGVLGVPKHLPDVGMPERARSGG